MITEKTVEICDGITHEGYENKEYYSKKCNCDELREDALNGIERVNGLVQTSLMEVLTEFNKAVSKYKPFNSDHEGYAVLLEEVDEMWEEVKKNDTEKAREECIQVAAMALRFLVDSASRDYKGQKNHE